MRASSATTASKSAPVSGRICVSPMGPPQLRECRARRRRSQLLLPNSLDFTTGHQQDLRPGGQVIGKLARRAHEKLRLRGWIAIGAVLLALVSAPALWHSRFGTERRAAFRLQRAQAHLDARELDQARADFRQALRLRPFDAGARLQLAAIELGADNWELAFLEYQSVTELHPENPDGWIGLAAI